jgi:hypothetical protein
VSWRSSLVLPMKGDARENVHRFAKALRIAAQVDAVLLASDLDPLREAGKVLAMIDGGDRFLTLAAVNSGEKPPSPETRAVVRAIYAARVWGLEMAPLYRPPANQQGRAVAR